MKAKDPRKIEPAARVLRQALIDCGAEYPDQRDMQRAIEKLIDKGWALVFPKDWPGICPRCLHIVEDGTVHEMWNGNQMGMCAVREIEESNAVG